MLRSRARDQQADRRATLARRASRPARASARVREVQQPRAEPARAAPRTEGARARPLAGDRVALDGHAERRGGDRICRRCDRWRAAGTSVVFGGAAAKVAAIVVAGVVVGGGTYEGVTHASTTCARHSVPAAHVEHASVVGAEQDAQGELRRRTRRRRSPFPSWPSRRRGRPRGHTTPLGRAVRLRREERRSRRRDKRSR